MDEKKTKKQLRGEKDVLGYLLDVAANEAPVAFCSVGVNSNGEDVYLVAIGKTSFRGTENDIRNKLMIAINTAQTSTVGEQG